MRYSKNFCNSLNLVCNYWKRNSWMLDLRTVLEPFRIKAISGPIFLLGNQGDGLTLLSRMLRRNESVVSVTGNSSYWTGASEMQNVYEPILPSRLSGIRLRAPYHEKLSPPRSWSYACDDLIGHYRCVEADANQELSKRLKSVISLSLRRHGGKIKNPRFLDKSQVFSVKMAFIDKLLRGTGPFFVHVTRNPYASIIRAATGKAGDMKRYAAFMDLDERIRLCIEHWSNTFKAIEEDKKVVGHYARIRFEDLLRDPKGELKKVCGFIGIEYDDDMTPQSHHKLPFGSRYTDRWHPIRVDVNDSYLSRLSERHARMIADTCGGLAERYGYEVP